MKLSKAVTWKLYVCVYLSDDTKHAKFQMIYLNNVRHTYFPRGSEKI